MRCGAAACPAAAEQLRRRSRQARPSRHCGRLLFVKDGDLWVWQTRAARARWPPAATWSQPSWSPDGANLAYVYRGTNFADIFVTDEHGETQTG